MKLIVQIPCYNEEKTLPLTVRDIPRQIEGVSFAFVIPILLNDELKRKEVGQRAKRFTQSHFSWDYVILKYLEVFRSIVSKEIDGNR